MAADVSKHLDRAKRFLEKNRVEDAIGAYLAVLDEMPNIKKPRRRWATCTREWISRIGQRFTTDFFLTCSWNQSTNPRRPPFTTGFGAWAVGSRLNVSLDTPSCSRDRIILTKRLSSTARRRSCLQQRTATKTHCSAGSGLRNSIRKIYRGSFALRRRRNASARMRLRRERSCGPGSLLRRAEHRPTRCTFLAALPNLPPHNPSPLSLTPNL